MVRIQETELKIDGLVATHGPEHVARFESVVKNDAEDDSIKTVVVGMHKALPYSISCDHSMNESPDGIKSGMKVYSDLLDLQNKSHNHVYVLASHSHFFMEDIYNTKFWHCI
jgi:hypothetical protein